MFTKIEIDSDNGRTKRYFLDTSRVTPTRIECAVFRSLSDEMLQSRLREALHNLYPIPQHGQARNWLLRLLWELERRGKGFAYLHYQMPSEPSGKGVIAESNVSVG